MGGSTLKLAIGKHWEAWRRYPNDRREFSLLKSGQPLFLTGTHRSGTTWAAKMIAAPGVWYIHEPFNPNRGRWDEPFSFVPPGSVDEKVDNLMREVLGGGFRSALMHPSAESPLMPLRLFRQSPRRILVKDPLACLLAGYLTRRFDLKTLAMFRHPCGFVSSVMRMDWPTGDLLKGLRSQSWLWDSYLNRFSRLFDKWEGSHCIEAAAVLHGALNYVLWHSCAKTAIDAYLFEEMCVDPVNSFRRLFEAVNLEYDDQVARLHHRLCFRSERPVDEYDPHEVSRNSIASAFSWIHALSRDEVTRIRDLWLEFEIPLYQPKDDWWNPDQDALIGACKSPATSLVVSE